MRRRWRINFSIPNPLWYVWHFEELLAERIARREIAAFKQRMLSSEDVEVDVRDVVASAFGKGYARF